MLSVDFIRNNQKDVETAAKNKNRDIDIDKILAFDDKRRDQLNQIQKLREERNELAKLHDPKKATVRGKEIKELLKSEEAKLDQIQQELDKALSIVPNVPLEEVPVGNDETGNKVIRTFGENKVFNFLPKSHIELGNSLDIFDLERGTKVSGFRGYFLKNEGAVLQLAVMFYVFQKLIKKGYTPFIAPSIVKGFTLFGSGQFPWGEQEVYKLNDEDAYLAGTAEVPITAYHSQEILSEKDLPKKYVAFSPCFRREAGAYGRDTKGLYRVHEFWKVEQVIIAKNDIADAKQLHEELQANTEEIMQDLGLSYRVLLMCSGDMGEPQIKKYDTELWMPYRNNYGEIASNSIMGDFQARRLNIKYRGQDGQIKYCYTLNDTAVPSPRILIALLENYQQEDGSVKIPDVLKNLTGFTEIRQK